MSLLRRIWYVLNRRRLERELEQEMAAHRAEMSEPVRFGSTLRLREEAAEVWGWVWLDDLGRDLRYGARQLIGAPRFTLAALSILTLGAGVSVSVLHVANAATFYRLSVEDADHLVRVSRVSPDTPDITSTFPYATAAFLAEHNTTFAYLAAESLGPRVSVDDDPAPREAAFVSGNYFHDLRVAAAHGRLFAEGDTQPGAPPVAVLGHRYWQRSLGGDPTVVDRVVRVNRTSVQVVGVLAPTFDGLGPPRATRVDIWMPMAVRPDVVEQSHAIDGGASDTAIYGMLRPGITTDAATSELRTLAGALRIRQPALLTSPEPIAVKPLREPVRFEADVAMLLALFFIVFFSACANVGNMLLARGVGRAREIEMRQALGAGRWRVIRQLMTENLLLGLLGCAAGSWGGYAGARVLLRYFDDLPAGVHLVLDRSMLTASIGLVVIAMLGFGLAPAFQAVRRHASTRLRQTMVAVQVASGVVLVILATLLARGQQRADTIDLAFDYRQTVAVDPQFGARAFDASARWALLADMTMRLEQMPGVDAVTAAVAGPVTTGLPLLGMQVAPSYFTVLGLPVVRGRTFLAREPNVVMISESGARALWPDQDALGQQWTDPRTGRSLDVVGIVRDSGLSARRGGDGEAYVPLADDRLARVVLLAHTMGDPHALLRDARMAAAPAGLVPNATTMEAMLNLPTSRGAAGLIAVLGMLATALAATGIFGLLAFTVGQRTREIAVRAALGARPVHLLTTVCAQYALPLTSGVLGGLLLAIAGSQVMRGQLHGLPALDPVSYATGISGLGVAAIAAMAVPAWRAIRINPAAALPWE